MLTQPCGFHKFSRIPLLPRIGYSYGFFPFRLLHAALPCGHSFETSGINFRSQVKGVYVEFNPIESGFSGTSLHGSYSLWCLAQWVLVYGGPCQPHTDLFNHARKRPQSSPCEQWRRNTSDMRVAFLAGRGETWWGQGPWRQENSPGKAHSAQHRKPFPVMLWF